MDIQIIHYNYIASFKRWKKKLFNISIVYFPIQRPIKNNTASFSRHTDC